MAGATICFVERQAALRARLREIEPPCEAMLVTSLENVRYLTGFTGSNGVAIVTAAETWFFTDPRYQFQAAQEVTANAKAVSGPLLTHAAKLMARKKLRRIGFEQDHLTAGDMELLGSKMPPRTLFLPCGGQVEMLRMVKSAEELAAIRQSVMTNSRALDAVMGNIRAGMSELELTGEIEFQMRKNGAEKPSFDTIVASGARSALPHAHPTKTAIERGALLIDMGTFENGYASDMTRTFFVGTVSREMRRIYKAVLEAQLAAIDAVRAGVTASTVDRAARKVLAGHGLDKAFLHSTGHGLGLEIHEPPRIGKKDKTRLEPGMAITIEPGAYVEGLGGVRIEDTVAVTANGCEILTPTSKALVVI
jgi:Xaa-Pro aminopeptidase